MNQVHWAAHNGQLTFASEKASSSQVDSDDPGVITYLPNQRRRAAWQIYPEGISLELRLRLV
jgi:hypothetical protein